MLTKGLWAARLIILIAFVDLFIQFPVMAPYARSLGATPAMIGLIVGLFSASNLAGNIVAGVLLDRWGRVLPIQAGLLATTAALLAYAFVQTPEQLLAARLLHGLATAVLTPGAFAMMGDASAPEQRSHVMGVGGAIIAVAAIAAPPLAGLLRDRLGTGAVFLADAGLVLTASLLFALLTRDLLRGAPSTARPAAARGVWRRLFQPRLLAAYLAAPGLTVGLGTLVTHLPLILQARGGSAAQSGLAFTAYAVVALLVMVSPMSRLSDRHERLIPASAGLLLIGIALGLLALAGTLPAVLASMALVGLGFGLLFPAATTLVAETASPASRGTAFGIFYALYSLGVVAGSLLSGLLAQATGPQTAAPFLAASVVAVLAAPAVLLIGTRLVVTSSATGSVTQ